MKDGKLFAVLFIIMTIVSIALLIRGTVEWSDGYIEACKDIADGRCQAKLERRPGGELRWVLKGVTEK